MKTIFTSSQIKVTEKHLEKYFDNQFDIKDLHLISIQCVFHSYGHYKIFAYFTSSITNVNWDVSRITTNTQLVDAFNSGMRDKYEDGEDGFENWDDVVDTLLRTIDAEEILQEYIYWVNNG